MEDFEDKEDALVEEEDEVADLSSVTIVRYLDITREIAHNCSVFVHIVLQLITLLRIIHN